MVVAEEETMEKTERMLDTLLASVWSIDELPGWLSKTLRVPKGHTGLLIKRDRSIELMESVVGKLTGFRRRLGRGSDLRAAAAVEAREFTLQPRVERLMAGDQRLVEAEFLLTAQVEDATRFYDQVLHGKKTLYASDLANRIAVDTEGSLQALVKEYASSDLYGDPGVVSRISGRLQALLTDSLKLMGLRLVSLQHLLFRDRVGELERLERARPLERRLREEQTKSRLEKVRSAKELEDALRQLEHEYELRAIIREQEMEKLKAQFAAPGAAAGDVADSAADVVHQEIVALEDRIGDQMHKEFLRLEQDIEEADTGPNRKKQAEVALRIVAIILTVAELALAFLGPDWIRQNERPVLTLILLLLPLALVVLAIVVLRMFQREEESLRGMPARLRVGLPTSRVQADRTVRAHIGRELRKLMTTLAEARSDAVGLGLKEWASQVKKTENKADVLRRQVENAQYGGADYFTKDKVSAVNLARMVDFDQEMLEEAEMLTHLTAEALQHLKVENAESANDIVKQVDLELNALSNRFSDRDAFLRSPV
jgi:hypothetical protein